jgi:uncharacterized protein
MKYSQFNSVIPFDNKYALYNSYYNKVIFIEETLKEILQAARHEGIDSLASIHPTFYEYLDKQGFLVEEKLDEVEKLKVVSKQIDENNTSFLLTINPSMNCNFKCWYCYETHVKSSSLNEEMIRKINAFTKKMAAKPGMQLFSVSFFGGEPLLYFKRDVIPVIDAYIEACRANSVTSSIHFTTNGYLINQDFIDYFKSKEHKCSLQITLDGYGEQHDMVRFVSASKGSYHEIINNIRLLITNGLSVRLRVNYTDKNLENSYKIGEEFADIDQEIKDRHLIFDFHRVWQDNKADDINIMLEAVANKVRSYGIYVLTSYSPNNVKESCYADKRNSAVINYNGDLFKCTARDFTNVERAGYLGEDGDLIWGDGYIDRRMSAKFNNKPCLSCRLMPLCNGGCSQHALEHLGGDEYCIYFGDETEKDKVIKTKVQEILNEAVPA